MRAAPFSFQITRQSRWRTRRRQRNASAATRAATEINGARVSRIRTFVKQVETALEAGDKDQARGRASQRVQPELARGVAKGVLPQEHRVPQIVAADARVSPRSAKLF